MADRVAHSGTHCDSTKIDQHQGKGPYENVLRVKLYRACIYLYGKEDTVCRMQSEIRQVLARDHSLGNFSERSDSSGLDFGVGTGTPDTKNPLITNVIYNKRR